MQWLGNNWIWVVFAVGMIAMHMFGHSGHGGHGGHGGRSGHGGHDDGSDPQEAKKSAESNPVLSAMSPVDGKHDHANMPSDLKSTKKGRKPSDIS